MHEFWFKPKRYGFGAAPSTWEGWALLATYIAAMLALGAIFGVSVESQAPKPLAFIAVGATLTVVFVFLCWRKTEGGWHWRWGKDD